MEREERIREAIEEDRAFERRQLEAEDREDRF